MFAGKGDQRFRQRENLILRAEQFVAREEAHRDRHLIVAAAPRMDAAPQRSERFREVALDGQVAILVGFGDFELTGTRAVPQNRQLCENGVALLCGENARLDLHGGEHGHMRGGSIAVPLRQTAVQNGVFSDGESEDVGIDGTDDGFCVLDGLFHDKSMVPKPALPGNTPNPQAYPGFSAFSAETQRKAVRAKAVQRWQ